MSFQAEYGSHYKASYSSSDFTFSLSTVTLFFEADDARDRVLLFRQQSVLGFTDKLDVF
jgi:hypothetical protein